MSVSTPVTGRKVRFALVGCGRISKNHLGAIVAHANDAELVDVCDIDPVSLQAAVSETGATGHTSLDAMLATTTADAVRSEEHTSELQSLMRISYAVFCLKKKKKTKQKQPHTITTGLL